MTTAQPNKLSPVAEKVAIKDLMGSSMRLSFLTVSGNDIATGSGYSSFWGWGGSLPVALSWEPGGWPAFTPLLRKCNPQRSEETWE